MGKIPMWGGVRKYDVVSKPIATVYMGLKDLNSEEQTKAVSLAAEKMSRVTNIWSKPEYEKEKGRFFERIGNSYYFFEDLKDVNANNPYDRYGKILGSVNVLSDRLQLKLELAVKDREEKIEDIKQNSSSLEIEVLDKVPREYVVPTRGNIEFEFEDESIEKLEYQTNTNFSNKIFNTLKKPDYKAMAKATGVIGGFALLIGGFAWTIDRYVVPVEEIGKDPMQAQIDSLGREITKLKENEVVHEHDLSPIYNEIESLRETQKTYNTEIGKISIRLSSLQAEDRELESELESISGTLDSLNNAVETHMDSSENLYLKIQRQMIEVNQEIVEEADSTDKEIKQLHEQKSDKLIWKIKKLLGKE